MAYVWAYRHIVAMSDFTERHADKIAFSLSCFDRVVTTGSLVDVGYPRAMTAFLYRLETGEVRREVRPGPM